MIADGAATTPASSRPAVRPVRSARPPDLRDRAARLGRGSRPGLRVGYVEQLYTFGDRGRQAERGESGLHVVSVGYLALTRAADSADALRATGAGFDAVVPLLSLGGLARRPARHPRPRRCCRCSTPGRSARRATTRPAPLGRRERLRQCFAAGGSPWDEEKALDRYELLYEAGLVEEARRDGRKAALERAELPALGEPMRLDHRRILATAIARLRAKLKYRPVIFELMAPEFTLTELQPTVEAISGATCTSRISAAWSRPAPRRADRRDVDRDRRPPGRAVPLPPRGDPGAAIAGLRGRTGVSVCAEFAPLSPSGERVGLGARDSVGSINPAIVTRSLTAIDGRLRLSRAPISNLSGAARQRWTARVSNRGAGYHAAVGRGDTWKASVFSSSWPSGHCDRGAADVDGQRGQLRRSKARSARWSASERSGRRGGLGPRRPSRPTRAAPGHTDPAACAAERRPLPRRRHNSGPPTARPPPVVRACRRPPPPPASRRSASRSVSARDGSSGSAASRSPSAASSWCALARAGPVSVRPCASSSAHPGAALIAAGEWTRRKESLPASPGSDAHIPSILTAAGTAVAYADVYAAYGLYDFIDPAAAFVLLGLVALRRSRPPAARAGARRARPRRRLCHAAYRVVRQAELLGALLLSRGCHRRDLHPGTRTALALACDHRNRVRSVVDVPGHRRLSRRRSPARFPRGAALCSRPC